MLIHRCCLVALLAALTVCLYGHGDVHEQIVALTAEIAEDPGNAELYRRRSELYLQHGEPDAAAADMLQAQRMDPAGEAYDFLLGRIYHQGGWHATALIYLDVLLEAEPDHQLGRLERAETYTALGDHTRAAADYDHVWPLLDRPTPSHALARASAHAQREGGGLEAAIAVLDEAIERMGDLVVFHDAVITYALELMDYDLALERVDRMMENARRKEWWHLRRGKICVTAGRTDEARAAFAAVHAAIDELPPHVRQRGTTQDLYTAASKALADLASQSEPVPEEHEAQTPTTTAENAVTPTP